MQYALFTLKGKQFIVDAHEYSALDTFEDSIKDVEPKPDENGPLYVTYGVYMPQPGIEWEDAMGHLLERQDVWLGHIDGEHCHALGFHQVDPLPPISHGRSFSIPFAALTPMEMEEIALRAAVEEAQAESRQVPPVSGPRKRL